MHNGILLSLVILAPNLLFLVFRPENLPPTSVELGIFKMLTAAERLGQVNAMVIPLFYSIEVKTNGQKWGIIVLIIAVIFYYAGWLRYLRYGKDYSLLFKPMLGIPVPMAVSPVIYFFTASLVLNSWLLFLSTLVFAIGHLSISYNSYLKIKN